MIRTYSVKYKSKSKMLTTAEAIAETENAIVEEAGAISAKIEDNGQLIKVEAAEEDFPVVMNKVVNIFRRIDDKSELSYKFVMGNN